MKKKYASLLQGNGLKVFKLFFTNWCTLQEASNIFRVDKQRKKKAPSYHRTVARYFSEFKKRGWLDTHEEKKATIRHSKNKIVHKLIFSRTLYRANLNFFYDYLSEAQSIKLDDDEKYILSVIAKSSYRNIILTRIRNNIYETATNISFLLIYDSIRQQTLKRIPISLLKKITKPFLAPRLWGNIFCDKH